MNGGDCYVALVDRVIIARCGARRHVRAREPVVRSSHWIESLFVRVVPVRFTLLGNPDAENLRFGKSGDIDVQKHASRQTTLADNWYEPRCKLCRIREVCV